MILIHANTRELLIVDKWGIQEFVGRALCNPSPASEHRGMVGWSDAHMQGVCTGSFEIGPSQISSRIIVAYQVIYKVACRHFV